MLEYNLKISTVTKMQDNELDRAMNQLEQKY